jgi:hypothetical protein
MKRTAASATILLAAASLLAAADPPCISGEQRAGYPHNIAHWAHPSDTGRYVGNYNGGGNLWRRHADPPYATEGTWGWDYLGSCFKRRVILGWWHERRYQGGVGAYKTDGPKVLPPLEQHHEHVKE